MVLKFGLDKQDSSRHLSISNHNIRKFSKKGVPKPKRRHASWKDYDSSSDEDVSISDCSSTDSDFGNDIKDYASSEHTTISALDSKIAPLSVSSPKKGKVKICDDAFGETENDMLLKENANKAGAAAAAVAQIRSKLQDP